MGMIKTKKTRWDYAKMERKNDHNTANGEVPKMVARLRWLFGGRLKKRTDYVQPGKGA
jgi:hypothetical protein